MDICLIYKASPGHKRLFIANGPASGLVYMSGLQAGVYIQMIQTSRNPVITAVSVKGMPNFMKVDDLTS